MRFPLPAGHLDRRPKPEMNGPGPVQGAEFLDPPPHAHEIGLHRYGKDPCPRPVGEFHGQRPERGRIEACRPGGLRKDHDRGTALQRGHAFLQDVAQITARVLPGNGDGCRGPQDPAEYRVAHQAFFHHVGHGTGQQRHALKRHGFERAHVVAGEDDRSFFGQDMPDALDPDPPAAKLDQPKNVKRVAREPGPRIAPPQGGRTRREYDEHQFQVEPAVVSPEKTVRRGPFRHCGCLVPPVLAQVLLEFLQCHRALHYHGLPDQTSLRGSHRVLPGKKGPIHPLTVDTGGARVSQLALQRRFLRRVGSCPLFCLYGRSGSVAGRKKVGEGR